LGHPRWKDIPRCTSFSGIPPSIALFCEFTNANWLLSMDIIRSIRKADWIMRLGLKAHRSFALRRQTTKQRRRDGLTENGPEIRWLFIHRGLSSTHALYNISTMSKPVLTYVRWRSLPHNSFVAVGVMIWVFSRTPILTTHIRLRVFAILLLAVPAGCFADDVVVHCVPRSTFYHFCLVLFSSYSMWKLNLLMSVLDHIVQRPWARRDYSFGP
jgi:hypothetical protein